MRARWHAGPGWLARGSSARVGDARPSGRGGAARAWGTHRYRLEPKALQVSFSFSGRRGLPASVGKRLAIRMYLECF